MSVSYIDRFADRNVLIANAKAYLNTVYGTHFHKGGVMVYSSSFSQNRYCCSIDYAAATIADFIKSSGGAYISINTFKKMNHGRAMRVKENLWGLSAIVLDIDVVHKNDWVPGRNEFIAFLKMNGVPSPNMVVESGSGGIHLYWTFEHLPASMRKSVQAVKLRLCQMIVGLEKEWDSHNLQLDVCATDVSRVIRVPGSTNQKTGKKATYQVLRNRRYRFKEFQAKTIPFRYRYDYLKKNVENFIARFRDNCPKQVKHFPKRFGTPEALAQNRIDEMRRLMLSGFRFEGCRERACFIVRNNALLLGWSEEKTMTFLNEMNNTCFHAPLSERELKSNSKARKHYKMKNGTIRTLLHLSVEDGFFAYQRKTKGRKAATQNILSQIASLVRKFLSVMQIAKALKVSVSLVKRRRAQLSKMSDEFLQIGLRMRGVAAA